MAFTGILASTVGLVVLIALTNGQTDVNTPLPACSLNATQAGVYTMAHPVYATLFIMCFGNNQFVMNCPEGTIYDTRINNCNHVLESTNTAAPCSGTTTGRNYPLPCCDFYFRCNGAALVRMACPQGQQFNAQLGSCGNGGCTDNAKCVKYLLPSANQPPCNMVAVQGNPCQFRLRNNGTDTEIQDCAEGTGLDLTACTCTANNNCMRRGNRSDGKTPDPSCRASVRVDFSRFQTGTNIPQAVSDKTGTDIPEYIQATGVQYGPNQATLTTNTITRADAAFYLPAFSNNQMANNVIIELVFRATAAGTFEAISNNNAGVCTSTYSINVVATGNGGYTVNGFVTGVTENGLSRVTNVATLTGPTINVGQNDFVRLRLIFNGRVRVQLVSQGTSGTTTFGQPITSPESGNIGEYLAFNNCGLQLARGLNGIVKSFAVREGCLNVDAAPQ